MRSCAARLLTLARIAQTPMPAQVMSQYNLGPNGAIVTSLNLFATRFDQVIDILERRAGVGASAGEESTGREGERGEASGQAEKGEPPLEYILVDTPGQIEIFTWSASGGIITELLASSFATVVCYVVDTPRCAAPPVFMSNMLYALSILYKAKLPMLLAFNKADVADPAFAVEWMTDFEAFHAALEADSSYQASLSRSMCLVLDEFYSGLKHVGVSAVTGQGLEGFFAAVDAAAEQYWTNYRTELDKRIADKKRREGEARTAGVESLKADLAEDRKKAGLGGGGSSGSDGSGD